MTDWTTDHEHDWQLTETGYSRSWHTEIEGTTIRAYFNGSEDFSETGAGDDHLECTTCGETKSIEGYQVDYQ